MNRENESKGVEGRADCVHNSNVYLNVNQNSRKNICRNEFSIVSWG